MTGGVALDRTGNKRRKESEQDRNKTGTRIAKAARAQALRKYCVS